MFITASIRRWFAAGFAVFALNSGVHAAELSQPRFDRNMTESALAVAHPSTGVPGLTIGSYDTIQGLSAIYEAANGKRIYFRSTLSAQGRVIASASHFNRRTQRIESFVTPAFVQSSTGEVAMTVGGVDFIDLVREGRKNKKFDLKRKGLLVAFVQDEVGMAFLDGVAALYIQLQTLEQNNAITRLKVPFGLIRTTLELVTGKHKGIDQLIGAPGAPQALALTTACAGTSCLFKSKQFIVHKSGLFDVVSNAPKLGINTQNCASPTANRSVSPGTPVMFSVVPTYVSDNPCFEMCGPQCFNPGDVWTPECAGHDLCVEGHGQSFLHV